MAKKNQRWLDRWQKDSYVKQASQLGYRSRAAFKLAQIDNRDSLFYPKMTVIDLGSTPGSWCQWVWQRLEGQVELFAVDILPMEPLPKVTFIQGDFTDIAVEQLLLEALRNRKVDLVMSDMSPNMSGIKVVDQSRALLLAELARDLALNNLRLGGHFLTKLFCGEGFDTYVRGLRSYFQQVVIRKPAASRTQSAEVYILAKHYCQSNVSIGN
ncbi:MAG: 23S rRNA methyltransferase [Beggiatoa sp. IS2]|nr:MAG: 23S rRNA methyltransferase [Beggiatoa sp. IS2]